jgi:hypothetical protein
MNMQKTHKHNRLLALPNLSKKGRRGEERPCRPYTPFLNTGSGRHWTHSGGISISYYLYKYTRNISGNQGLVKRFFEKIVKKRF